MNTLLIRKALLMLLFVFSTQLLLAQQLPATSKQNTHPIHFNTANQLVVTSTATARYDATSEELLKKYPEAVRYEKRFFPAGKNNFKVKTVKVIDHAKLNAMLARSVEEQQTEIQQLQKEVSSLKSK